MGEAKRRKLAQQAVPPRPAADELALMSQAMQKVLGAITGAHGADCLAYAAVGARVLTELGYPARAAAGSAAWRVGPGDGDVLSHAVEMLQNTSILAKPDTNNVRAGMFHAWIECGQDIVDFTTVALEYKARQLDALDGGRTQVDWKPAVLWVGKDQCRTFHDVKMLEEGGVFAYRRHEHIERAIFERDLRNYDAEGPAAAVLATYRALKAGQQVVVVGLGADGPQTLEQVQSGERRFRPV